MSEAASETGTVDTPGKHGSHESERGNSQKHPKHYLAYAVLTTNCSHLNNAKVVMPFSSI